MSKIKGSKRPWDISPSTKLRKQAKLEGKSTYFTGKPCKHGHIAPRTVSRGVCIECQKNPNPRWGYKDLETRKRNILQRVKAQATMKGIPFDIQVVDIEWPAYCPILGVKLEYFAIGGRKQNSVSVDRIDSTKGYIKGNVGIISVRANSIKSDADIATVKRLLHYMESNGK